MKQKLKLYVSGRKKFGADVFEMCLRSGHEVVGVCSPAFGGENTDLRLAYGDGDMRWDRLRFAADRGGVPWLEAGNLRGRWFPEGVDLIIAAHSYDFISKKVLARCRLGGIGYHPSLLPRHRGRDAVRWTVKMGDSITGGSVYWLTDYIDGGPIAAREWCFVRPDDTAESLWRRELFPIGVRLFESVLGDLAEGVIVSIPQEEGVATWEPSWERPPLFRPDLPMIGAGLEGFEVVKERTWHVPPHLRNMTAG